MKNLFVIPTMGMSTLYKRNDLGTYHIGPFDFCKPGDELRTNQYVYVTNDEDIKDNDYIITKDGRLVQVSYLLFEDLIGGTKVVMTNDPDLVREDVEPIPEKFFDWFVDNSDCETVNVRRIANGVENHKLTYGYKIYNPRVEPKKVLTEEDIFNQGDIDAVTDYINKQTLYDESEVLELLLNRPGPYLTDDEIKEWFNEVKKK
jgi:hypothetical protein